ncbi:MAG: FHA domain-containing protein [Deltaproteobacteria bacterium]|nr:FHA domain-containing protein [Kofleriaceae bacterium]
MVHGCPRCGDAPGVGVLCGACAGAIVPRDGLLPDHVRSTRARADAAGWLVDGFGAAHPIGVNATVGRGPTGDVIILDGSVSRDHAELTRGEGGWQLRDLGSRNGTQLDGQRVNGRALLPRRALVRFGDIAFVFIGDAVPLPDPGIRSIATGHAAGDAVFRYTMRGGEVELCLVGARNDTQAGGALLYRPHGQTAWAELSLPPLEFQLLRMLCDRALADSAGPTKVRGCVPTRQLARELPFQSRYANEENVRQVVRRVRASLASIGADGLVEAVPGRGYYLTWPVTT